MRSKIACGYYVEIYGSNSEANFFKARNGKTEPDKVLVIKSTQSTMCPVEPVCVDQQVTNVVTFDIGPIYNNSEVSK